jgi:DNA-binding NtrC family response regulator/ligand-binding sensor domain-containing protein
MPVLLISILCHHSECISTGKNSLFVFYLVFLFLIRSISTILNRNLVLFQTEIDNKSSDKMKNRITLSFLTIGIVPYLVAQALLAQSLPFKNYSIEDGLVQSTVVSILQDSKGFLWYGTESGVSKFDGITFTNFSAENGFSDSFVYSIMEDRNKNLWFGTFDDGVFCLQDGEFINYTTEDGLVHNRVFAVIEDSKGIIWIGTYEGVSSFQDSTFTNYTTNEGLSHNWVRPVMEDSNGNIWFGTDSGISSFSNGKFTNYYQTDGLAHNRISSIFEDNERNLWIGTFGGVSRFTDGDFANYLTQQGTINDITLDSQGRLFFGTSDGVFVFENDHFRNFTSKGKLVGTDVYSIVEDKEGNLWFGTTSGVSVLSSEMFTNYTVEHGLIENQVWAFTEDSQGRIWFATNGGVSSWKDGEFTHYTSEDGLASDIAMSAVEDSKGNIWFGTDRGLSSFSNSKFTNYIADHGLGSNVVVYAIEDREGSLWFATYRGGVSRFRNGEFTNYAEKEGLQNSVETIFEDRAGTLWFGTTTGGLYSFGDGKFTSYTKEQGLAGDHVFGITEDKDGQLWIATEAGLSCFTGGKFLNYTSKDGLSDNKCIFVIEDDSGFIWVGTKRGLNRFDGKSFKTYTKKDGLASSEMNDTAVFKDSAGDLWFGTVNGASKYNHNLVRPNRIPPPIYLTQFGIFDRDTTLTDGIRLNHNQNYISLGYVGLCFTSPEDVIYSYKLEGLDKDWHISNLRTAQYAFLPPKAYTFKVKARNNDGVWNEEPAEFSFVITPPFWQEWWFRTLIILVILSSAFAWYRRRIKKIEAKRKELEVRVKEKTEAAEALQSALGEVEQLKNRLQDENIYLQDEIKVVHNFENIITRSKALKKVLNRVEQVASTDATVLILGESGTGKELVARAVHKISDRGDRPLVKVNCSALPANLIESELFGHEKGAFTGAIAKKIGRFELANGSTIFLDEIGDLPLELQAKLLRVLQEGEFERLGNPNTIKVDVRVIAATNRDLEKEMEKANFREDLYFRLNVFPIEIPPLRERKEDIALLVNHFIKKFSRKLGKDIETIPQNVIDTLQAYHWPGNVRELENIIERAVIITPGEKLVLGDWLPQASVTSSASHFSTLEDMERDHIIEALEMTGWQVSGEQGAAKILGMNSQTLVSRMKKLQIKRKV